MSDKKASTENSDELSLDELKAVAGGTGGAGMPPSQYAPGQQPLPPMPGQAMPGQGMVGFEYGGATGGDPGMPDLPPPGPCPNGGDGPGFPPPGDPPMGGDMDMPPPGDPGMQPQGAPPMGGN